MVGAILSFLRGRGPFPETQPERPFFAIGDVHGCADLLVRMLDRIGPGEPVVCVGDYVDRGEDSARVLTLLRNRPETLCLRGNHEDMLLAFLDDPHGKGPRWLRYGGLQTLASFGVRGLGEAAHGPELETARDRLREAMGPDLVEWISRMPLWHRSGNVAVVHAAANPLVPVEGQSNDCLLWGHPAFLKSRRGDGIWVVHGHTITDAPSARNGRISVDTGAYATGRLTAARIETGKVTFLTV